MPAERAGYTVTMFLIDVSRSMGTVRTVDREDPDGSVREIEMTNLAYALQYVKLKIQEMIFNGRKTDQCGVILFGSEDTRNIVNAANGGYENVYEFIPIGQPNAGTIAKIDALEPSTTTGDPIDALIVGVETQARYLANKKTWTRKIVIITDGESPIEVEDWEATVAKMDSLSISLIIVGVDFDDEFLDYTEEGKSNIKVWFAYFCVDLADIPSKAANEKFYRTLTSSMADGRGVIGNCDYALQDVSRPEVKQVRSTLMATVLRIGDVDARPGEAIELSIKTSKCTALVRPKSWKKFALRESNKDEMDVDEEEKPESSEKIVYASLKMKTDYYIDLNAIKEGEDGDIEMKKEDDDESLLDPQPDQGDKPKKDTLDRVEKEELVRGFKYGTTYAPCPDGQFPRLPTRKGVDICGFFPRENFRRELAMGEIQYIWADPSSPQQQVALSSIVKAMQGGFEIYDDKTREKKETRPLLAIARWVTKDGMDPKMGILWPNSFDNVDCLLWCPVSLSSLPAITRLTFPPFEMPFADDVRKYTFASLDRLVNRKGEVLTEHPYLPTDEQMEAMNGLVDAMDLMNAGEKDEEGNRLPWFSTPEAFNPAVHRIKQAMFHCAVFDDITSNPVPPPHPDLLVFFEPPKRAMKRGQNALQECKDIFKVKEVLKRVGKAKKDGHAHAQEEDDNLLLLDRKRPLDKTQSQMSIVEDPSVSSPKKSKQPPVVDDGSETEEEDEELLLDKKNPAVPEHRKDGALPTPARSVSPHVDPGRAPGRIIGNTYPLKDFRKNIAQGDVVTKAVEDLSAVILEVIVKPFASRRKDEMLECMEVLRQTCLEEDEIDAWNGFMHEIKDKCLSKPGNPSFWEAVRQVGRELSLISKQEAGKQGGDSTVTENEAGEFIS
ncbi:hypothetical protein NLJ89_g2081 [Agrocybe chaxingu]|uniref:ATP-dependent DNA helicase II subunit 2 n=1 Tax=Agrocybe chaxingu TaxID=84603 RepID=A0A9W8K6J5_9AGAR|nr:hypothetical protein NLJ89_g2081 [Agrocybe chaxingu]